MKANELRIGSYINDDMCNEIMKVDASDIEMIYDEFGVYSPISLTKEWLLKFGFEEDGVLIDYAICLSNEKILGVDLKNKRAHCYHIKPSVQGANLCSVKYVHQLQNLYFSLTNEELKVI